MRIVIASSDLIHAKMTRFLLQDVGYEVIHNVGEKSVQETLREGRVDLVLLDADLPERGGYELCRELRAQYHTPIIFVADGTLVDDRVRALKLGADDFVSKPYNPNELLARIEAVMRRYGDEFLKVYAAYQPLSVGPVHLDPVQRRVILHGTKEENLTEREFQLLYYLVQNARCVLSSRQLLQKIWGLEDVTDSNLVPVYIGRLRRKIEANPMQPNYIVRVRDLGYSFRPN
jgi:DNA-binding response OmpR family regulator